MEKFMRAGGMFDLVVCWDLNSAVWFNSSCKHKRSIYTSLEFA